MAFQDQSARHLPADSAPLVRKLESIIDLSESERASLSELRVSVRELGAEEVLVAEGDHPRECCLVLEGFLFRHQSTATGERQIFSFHIPGEFPDLQSLHLATMDHSLSSLGASKIGIVPHEAIRRLLDRHPRIGWALWRETLIDAAVFRAWILGLGRRSATARTAHFFCEMFTRLEAVGLTSGDTFRFPVVQPVLAEALGMSAVHMNRVLQSLRKDGLVLLARSGRVQLPNYAALREAGEFEPTYLHFKWQDKASDGRLARGA